MILNRREPVTGARGRLVAVPLVVLGMLSACGEAASPQDASGERRATPVRTTIVEPQPFRDLIQLTGTVEALNDATLSAQAAGTVRYLVELGTSVAAGDIVARLDRQEARAAVRQAEAGLASAQAEYELALADYQRGRALHQDSTISNAEFQELKAKLEQAEAAVKQAEADLAQAQEQLSDTRITAPFSGTVEQHFVDQGEQISAGQPVARVVNTRRVRIVAPVPERYVSDIAGGAPVRLRFRAYDDVRRQKAEVTFVGRTIDPESRTFTVEIERPNAQGLLKPGMVLRLWLTRDVAQNALSIPRGAIVRDETGAGVFVVNRGDSGATVQKREVVLGADSAGSIVVTSGLEAGAEIVISGQDNLVPGEPVKVVEVVEDPRIPREGSGPGARP